MTHLFYDETNKEKALSYNADSKIICDLADNLANYLFEPIDFEESTDLDKNLIQFDKFQFDSSYQMLLLFSNQQVLKHKVIYKIF